MYIYGPDARIDGDDQHNKVVDSLTTMEGIRNKVVVGLILFWLLWLAGIVWWINTYAVPFFS